MSVDSVQQLASNYSIHIDEAMLLSQTVAAAAFLRSRFSDVMLNCDMNAIDILSALEVGPTASGIL